jgi:hypothetical protein
MPQRGDALTVRVMLTVSKRPRLECGASEVVWGRTIKSDQ